MSIIEQRHPKSWSKSRTFHWQKRAEMPSDDWTKHLQMAADSELASALISPVTAQEVSH
jgi:hypothetical protein